MHTHERRLWVVIPAAGVGRRMSGSVPKQYLRLDGRTVLEWSLAVFLERSDIAGIAVAISADDQQFASLTVRHDQRIVATLGGTERADSVLNGLRALMASHQPNDHDWVLVHDAARPCLHADDLQRLIAALQSDEVGGLLAVPLTDTLKAADSEQRVTATPPRDGLWRALTPQMFRFSLLKRALEQASGKTITDESAAIESLGLKPKLITGRSDNIKITLPEDVRYAEFILRQRRGE